MRGGAPLQNNGAAPPLENCGYIVYCVAKHIVKMSAVKHSSSDCLGNCGPKEAKQFRIDCHINDKTLDNPLQCNANVSSGLCRNQQMLEIILFMFFLLLLPSQFSKNTTLFQPTLALTKTVWSPCYRNSIIRRNSVQFVFYVCQPANRSDIQSSILL